jgi:hypothetical protein
MSLLLVENPEGGGFAREVGDEALLLRGCEAEGSDGGIGEFWAGSAERSGEERMI